jgi:biotin synthase
LMSLEAVVAEAQAAKANGSTRFCMGAAWREVKDGPQFRARIGNGDAR